jgi:heme o synthase
MAKLRDFLSLIKIGVTASNALTAAAGLALASAALHRGLPWLKGALVVAGSACLVAGACAVNNWIDRDIDAVMERTRSRPTARGAMGAAQALGIGAGLAVAGLALLFAASPASAALGLAGAMVYILPYSLWSKRRGPMSLYIGGLAGSAPPLIGWSAVDPSLGGPAWVLFLLLAAWQQAHVRALALKRADEYRAAGVPLAGLERPASAGLQGAAGVGPASERRARLAAIAWAAACLPFPCLALLAAGIPFAGMALAFALASCALGAAWVAVGLAALKSPAWPARMFAASLAYLVLVFGGLFAAFA